MAKVQSKDNEERSGDGGGRKGSGGGDFLSYLSGASPLPPTASGSSSAPVFLPADVARVGKDDAAPRSDVEPIEPSAPPLSEFDAEESRTNTYSMPSVIFATPILPPFAPSNYAMASTTTPVDDYVIATPLASSATTMVAFLNRPSEPPEMTAFHDRHQPPSTGNEAWDATTPLSAPANQGGYEQRIREYKLGLVSLGLLAAVAIIAAVIAMGVYRPDPPSAAPTSALISSPTKASSSASPTAIPTSTPTTSPTSAPTASPSEYPTTASPLEYQTTASPPEYPTTASPTITPTTSPITASPSKSPITASPLVIPTSAPVAYPSVPWTWKQQGQSIVGDSQNDEFGSSMAMSADAKILVVGAIGSNNDTGYVKVYHTNDGWNSVQLIGQSLLGDAVDDHFGWSVSISSDGTIVAIGAPELYDRPGYVRVFYQESDGIDSSWKQLGQDITGEAIGDGFGISVSLSGDGKTLAVGASDHDGNGEGSGCVRIYRLEDDGTSNWEQIGQDIYGEAAGDRLGYSVSLSADGTTVVIGAPYNYGNGIRFGQVRVYQIDSAGSTWEQLGQDINGEAVHDELGTSLDISSDGKILAIGAPAYWKGNNRPGYVRVYYLESNDLTSSWMQLGQDIIGEADGEQFGISVSLSGDGKTLAFGAIFNAGNNVGYSGHVRVYRMDDSSTSWTRLGQDIASGDYHDRYGMSVSLSADGTTVATGAPGNDDNGHSSGHVRIFSIK